VCLCVCVFVCLCVFVFVFVCVCVCVCLRLCAGMSFNARGLNPKPETPNLKPLIRNEFQREGLEP
jgi:hypothetical protein